MPTYKPPTGYAPGGVSYYNPAAQQVRSGSGGALPPVGWARVYSLDPPLSVTARLADAAPVPDSGFGGWEEVARPRRSPLTTWQGSPGLHLSLPLLFDGFAQGQSVESQLAVLVRMAQPTAADGAPPRVLVRARGAAIPFQAKRWVIQDLAYGDALMDASGNRTRAQVTLSLVEYVADQQLVERGKANTRRAKAAKKKTARGATKKRVTAGRRATSKKKKTAAAGLEIADDFGQGEDLLAIAARELGDASRWTEIATLNGLRDPRAIVPGQVIRLP